jgi:hypothetical protein
VTLPGRLYLIGGSPFSGKSSIASALAAKHGLAEYHCDDHWGRHTREADPGKQPTLTTLAGMSPSEIFLRPLREMLRDNIAALREEFPLVLRDLSELDPNRPVIAEGMTFLPEMVAGLEHHPPAVWVVPRADFQVLHYARREWAHGIAAATSHPEEAFENWMRRDAIAARYVRLTARRCGFRVLVVDGSLNLEESTRWVERELGLA